MSRDDLVTTNQAVMSEWGGAIRQYAPDAVVIVVTNPLDAMAQAMFRATGFPRERVLGMAGVLDSARFRTFIAEELNVSVSDVTAFVLGGHGDAMVPLARYSTVAGVPLPELLSEDRINALANRTANGGAEIVNLLKSGSAFYAPSAAVLAMVDSVILDQRRVMPCSVYLDGEYGYRDVFLGVPVKVGARGVEEILQIDLTGDEKAALDRSADSVRELLAVMRGASGAPAWQLPLWYHGASSEGVLRREDSECFVMRRAFGATGEPAPTTVKTGSTERTVQRTASCCSMRCTV
jgi:malate dehydrogenase